MGNQYSEIPFGSRAEDVYSGATKLGTYKFENIRISRGTRIIERPNEVGSTKGTASDAAGPGWGGVDLCPTMTATLQIPEEDSAIPTPLTDWISDTWSGAAGATAEMFVFTEVGQLFAMDGYLKCDVSLRYAANPPATWVKSA